ncbi:CAP domain-containing protein [bacterium]|nr:CAP domain-containing protein [bacterium]
MTLAALLLAGCKDSYDHVEAVDTVNGEPPFFLRSAAEREIDETVADLARRAGAPALSPDMNLHAAARNVALVVRESDPDKIPDLDGDVVKQAMTSMGVADNAFRSLVFNIRRPGDARTPLDANFRAELENGRNTHFGVGAARVLWPPMYVVAVLLTRRGVDLDPFPTQVDAGSTHPLKGRLLVGGDRLEIHVVGGRDDEVYGPAVGIGGYFEQEIAFDRAGPYNVEVVVTTWQGPEVAALFDVAARGGGDAAAAPKRLARVSVKTADAAVARTLELVNEARKNADLSPVSPDARLSRLAFEYAREIARTGLVAHVSPATGDAGDRAERAGIDYRRITENLGVDQSVEDIHEGLMRSPAHRRNILDPQVDLVGIGAVLAGGQIYIVQNFARLAPD